MLDPSSAWSLRIEDELPPLPKPYYIAVMQLAKVTKEALSTTLQANQEGYSEQGAARLKEAGSAVNKAVDRYVADYLDPGVVPNLDPLVREHPVYYNMQKAVKKLKSGGAQAEDLTRFRLDLIREMTALIRLTERAGMS
mmetsp:Transcript_24230/g.54816  ORF Transcript_24230/g.54816 Transcript_24230/m.54816 type:complete len:139 (+) Transcript_24230:1-417(+)